MTDVTTLPHDDVTRMLATQITSGIESINKANEVLLADDSGTGVREIDKLLKEGKFAEDVDAKVQKEITSVWNKAEAARKAYKELVDNARNLYRTNVLGEDAVEASADEDELKNEARESRSLVMKSVDLLKTYAQANGMKEIVAWAESLAVPQAGRQGTSNVGQKKPRAYVTVNGTVHESFGEAAKAATTLLSSDDAKVDVSSGDLVGAYYAAGEAENFEFKGLKVKVVAKAKASDKASEKSAA